MQRYLQHCCVHLQVDLSEKKECYLRVAGSMKKGSSHAAVIEALAGHFKVMPLHGWAMRHQMLSHGLVASYRINIVSCCNAG